MRFETTPTLSITLPSNALPNDAAIIVGQFLPPCMQATYSAAIFWRPKDTQTGVPLNDNLYYFIAQGNGASGPLGVHHGVALYDPVAAVCDYFVFHEVLSTVGAGPTATVTETWGDIGAPGAGLAHNPPLWQFLNTDVAESNVTKTITDTTITNVNVDETFDSASGQTYNGNTLIFAGGLSVSQGHQYNFRDDTDLTVFDQPAAAHSQTAYIAYDSYQLQATALVACGTTPAVIPGTSRQYWIYKATDHVKISATFDFEQIAAGGTVAIGSLFVGGNIYPFAPTVPNTALFSGGSLGRRATITMTWDVTGLAPGLHTFDLRASAVAAGQYRCLHIHTVHSGIVFFG